jgi:CRP-like cAMP-binding protein
MAGKSYGLLLRFTQALIIQTEQITVGNRHHPVEQQLCHFLLMILDRLPGNELQITHAQVSIFLGVRRETITMAAQKLEAIGAIRYRRGHMAVLDRGNLKSWQARTMQSLARNTDGSRNIQR